MSRKTGVCVSCGKEDIIKAKGLCTICYQQQYRRNNPDKLKKYNKTANSKPKTEEQKQKRKEYLHQKYLEHQEEYQARAIERNHAHIEQKHENDKKYRQSEAGRESTRRSKQKRKELLEKNHVETVKLIDVYKKYDGICQYCGIKCDWEDYVSTTDVNGKKCVVVGKTYPTCDHIIPVIKDGENSYENVVLACRGCNEKKGAQLGWINNMN